MTDLEMTKLCAEAMGLKFTIGGDPRGVWLSQTDGVEYRPIHNDAQAMALVKKLGLHIDQRPGKACSVQDHAFAFISERRDCVLNRAIVECVAKMQASSSTRL